MLRNGNDIVWGNSPEELKEKYGSKVVPRSFRALFGTIRDNPVLRKMRPEYESVLLSLPRVERERLYYGNWFARPEGSGYWSADWCEEILCPPPASEFTKICRAYDFAGTLPNELNHGRCDYTACVKFGKLRSGDYVILEVIRHHIRFGDWEDFILENARRDGSRVDIILPIDPNPAAEASTRMLVRKITSEGYFVTTKKTNNSKVDRFRPFASACQNGLVRIVRNCATDLWDNVFNDNVFFYNELENFQGLKEINDMADCCSDAFMYLAQTLTIPKGMLSGLQSFNTASKSPLLNIN